MTDTQLLRTENEWSKIAGETILVEHIGGAVYGFGSELGCLRLLNRFRYSKPEEIKVDYSENQESWFFRLETRG
jgi:hypothetical protein